MIGKEPPQGFEIDGADIKYGEAESWYQLVVPLYHHASNEPGEIRMAFYSEQRYISSLNRVHGGKLSSFTDYLLYTTAASTYGAPVATVSLNMNFVSACPADEWVIGYGRIVRSGRNMAFTSGEVRVGDQVIVQATGTFRKL